MGVACGVIAGGCTPAVLACPPPEPAIRDGSSSGTRAAPANDALGAGPMAAPTATPTPSMSAARAAVMRGDGVGKEDFWLSGVLFIASGPVLDLSDLSNKIANLDRIYRDMLCSGPDDVNSLSTLI